MEDFTISDITGKKDEIEAFVEELIKTLQENKGKIKDIICSYQTKGVEGNTEVSTLWQGETFMALIGLAHHIGHCVEEEWNHAEGSGEKT